MKNIFSILFLALILFQSVSGLFILGYYNANKQYISQNLCVNRFDAVSICKGKCFLTKKLKEKEQSEKKFPDLKKQSIQLYSQKSFSNEFINTSNELILFNFSRYNASLPEASLKSVFRPPQLA
ncbi:hypothetical protein [Aurantibacillus circumpalustris]|uniref:hypothetical protein n=1 Tax=Aurantibacillus circumpalustris TaxID=3036359 RepID=UPI00295A882D|nr:hypothetical protein [Aurantibacillus circumpalustris]